MTGLPSFWPMHAQLVFPDFHEGQLFVIYLFRSQKLFHISTWIECRWLEDNFLIHSSEFCGHEYKIRFYKNKANMRDLIAATGPVIWNWIQIVNFSANVTVKFDGWPPKTIGHFFHTTSSFVHHFKSIGEFKPDSQSRNAQFGSKLVICYPVWPWNLMDDLWKQKGTSSMLLQVLCNIS